MSGKYLTLLCLLYNEDFLGASLGDALGGPASARYLRQLSSRRARLFFSTIPGYRGFECPAISQSHE